jgi:hypothetical protein
LHAGISIQRGLTSVQTTSTSHAAALASIPTPPAPVAPTHKTPEERRARNEVTVAPLRLSSRRYYPDYLNRNPSYNSLFCTEALVALNLRMWCHMQKKVLLKKILNLVVRLGQLLTSIRIAFVCMKIWIDFFLNSSCPLVKMTYHKFQSRFLTPPFPTVAASSNSLTPS